MSIKPLSPAKLRRIIKPKEVFRSSGKIQPPIFIGRERAQRALEFGLNISDTNFHLFALGPSGVGKKSTILHLLHQKVLTQSQPEDWCYINNFQEPNKPIALNLPAGQGQKFKKAIDHLVKEIRLRLIRAFESDEFARLTQVIDSEELDRKQQEIQNIKQEAAAYGYQVTETPFGMAFVPVIGDRPLDEKQISELPASLREKLLSGRRQLASQGTTLASHLRTIERDANQKRDELNHEIARLTIEPLISELKQQFTTQSKVLQYINDLRQDVIDNASLLKDELQAKPEELNLKSLLSGDHGSTTNFNRYAVNLFIAHDNHGAPVITETLPTVPHLIGSYEFQPRLGGMLTDFTLIQPGALHKANGGYLVLDALEVLSQPYAWEVLKSILKNRCIRIEDIGERLPFSIPTPSLRPEPIPLTARVVLIGEPIIYYLLAQYDKDFLELFKVKVDFDTEAPMTRENLRRFSDFINHFCEEELRTKIETEGIARLAEESARLANHQQKMSLAYRQLTDILREAKYWADKTPRPISADDIKHAVYEQIYRSDLVEEKIQAMINEGTLFIDITASKIGQVNGLSVISLGDYQFGKPARITARTFVGKEGVVNIERQIDLSGPIHGKGVLILAHYLGGQYAQNIPLALSATLTFEQEYGLVEGDSATLSELCALLSALSDLPVRQDLAITGSVNQYGQVQPVGGVNEKIEGFFAICQAKSLTGNQGIILPAANIKHLMLKDEVINAVAAGQFHVYGVNSVDEAIELLTAKSAGAVHSRALSRLQSYTQNWRRFAQPET